MNRLFFLPTTGSRHTGSMFFTSALLFLVPLLMRGQPYESWPLFPAGDAFPYTGSPLFWTPSLHLYEKSDTKAPSIGMHWRLNTGSLLRGVTQWGIARQSGTYSLFATPRDVVLNASEGEDLIFTNLSGSAYPLGTNDKGAIRFGTALANGSGAIPADVERMTILNNGNVGINQTSPTAKLQVTDGAVLFNGTTGGTPVSGAGTRFMWIPGKAALRAGSVSGTEWNDGYIGEGSVALGDGVWAQGERSVALGDGCTAIGNSSVALGLAGSASERSSISFSTSGAMSSGVYSITMGFFPAARGTQSIAIGSQLNAYAFKSIVLGANNIVDDNSSEDTWIDTDPLLVVGNGNAMFSGSYIPTVQSNALTILKNGNTGIGDHEPFTTRLLVKSSGNTNATTALDVRNSDDDPLFFVGDDGKIGVGTSAPDALLSVTSTSPSPSSAVSLFRIDNAIAAEPLLVVQENGFVGIGAVPCSTDADAGVNIKLRVNGTIKAKEIIVETDGWCDFVFEEGYELMPLEVLEKKIEELGHLPNIPSAKDVEENGVNVSEMQVKLLQKVEELTLYVIELKKENGELNERLKKMEAEL